MESIIDFIKGHKIFALFCHESPDGDALGSISAMKLALKKLGKTAYTFCDGEIPKNLIYLNTTLDNDENLLQQCDAFMLLDCNSPSRIGKFEKAFLSHNKHVAVVDHHIKVPFKAQSEYIFPSSPSACDLVFQILNDLNVEIDKNIAKFLYAGISSDTGCFVHPSTTTGSHKNASVLIEKGIDLAQANYNLFKFKPKSFLKFLKYYINHTKSYFNGKLFVSVINYKNYKKYKEVCDSCDYSFMQGIEGNEICVRLTEKTPKVFNLSFRSNYYVDVNKIAGEFNGGGHKRASGAHSAEKKNVLISKIVHLCKNSLESDK